MEIAVGQLTIDRLLYSASTPRIIEMEQSRHTSREAPLSGPLDADDKPAFTPQSRPCPAIRLYRSPTSSAASRRKSARLILAESSSAWRRTSAMLETRRQGRRNSNRGYP